MSTSQLCFKTKIGYVSIKESKGYITDINFKKTKKKNPTAQLLKAKKQIKQFLNKKRKKFNFKVDIAGSKIQIIVWNEIRKIRYGKTATYNLISKRIKMRPRIIGKMCSKNKLLLYIPCHRVIMSNGSLGGYSGSGGVITKNKLLIMENLKNNYLI